MRMAGVILGAIGLAIIAYALTMDITVSYGAMYWERVANADLMSRRMMLCVLGAAAAVAGIILISMGLKNHGKPNIIDSSGYRPCKFCAELIKLEAKKCRYCGSGVEPSSEGKLSPAIPIGSGSSHGWVVLIPAEYPAQLERRIGVAIQLGQTVISGMGSPIICGYFESRPDADALCKRLYAECEIESQTKYISAPSSPAD